MAMLALDHFSERCVYACACVCAHAHTCEQVWRPEVDIRCFPLFLCILLISGHSLSLNMELTTSARRGQQAPRAACLRLSPSAPVPCSLALTDPAPQPRMSSFCKPIFLSLHHTHRNLILPTDTSSKQERLEPLERMIKASQRQQKGLSG